jgi:hypothetical protein
VIGGGDPYLQSVIDSYMKSAGNHIQDTSLGAQIYTFNKLSAAAVEQVNSGLLSSLFSEGLGMLTYFGHSSANSMEFNLDDPSIFDNQGKYPLFMANGCNAGNFFTYDTLRATAGKRNISENYVLIPNKGSIGFIASTHYGIVNYLNLYTNIFYRRMAREDYQSTIGDLQKNVSHEVIASGGNDDFYNVMTVEQILLGGDPAVRLYPHPLPDFAVEDPLIRISPTPLSVTNSNFDLKVKYYNLGKAVNDSVRLQIKREMPDGSLVVLYDQNRGRVYASDSVSISVPINPYTDRGQNKIIVQIDSASLLNEITRINNNVTKSFSIAEDEVRPVYPLNFAIVNSNKIKLTATTNQFLQVQKSFIVEVDTTENFNSPIKVSQTQSSIGGVIEFSPVIPLKDSVVFYWRVAKVPDTGIINKWSNSSFVYIPTSSTGWSQSHYFQYLKDTYNGASFIGRNLLNFEEENTYQFSSGLIPYFGNTVRKNLELTITNGCGLNFNSIEFVILNSFTGKLTRNKLIGSLGVYNSSFSAACSSTNPYQFYYSYNNSLTRKYAANLFDSIPNGTILIMSNWVRSGSSTSNQFIDVWKGDKNIYGVNNSLYDKLKSIGLSKIDSFYREIPFLFIVKKDVDGSWKVLEQHTRNYAKRQLTWFRHQ